MKKIMFFAVLLTLVGGLLATMQVLAGPPALAGPKKTPFYPTQQVTEKANKAASHGNPQGKRVNYQGTITAVSASSLTISLRDGSSVTFVLDSETRIKIPTLGRTAAAANLKTGMLVNVHAAQAAGGVLNARMVLMVPGKPVKTHRVGQVTIYQPDVSITIQAKDGNTYTFLLSADTKILPAERASQLAVGVRVTVIAPRDVAGGTLTAAGIVVHPSP